MSSAILATTLILSVNRAHCFLSPLSPVFYCDFISLLSFRVCIRWRDDNLQPETGITCVRECPLANGGKRVGITDLSSVGCVAISPIVQSFLSPLEHVTLMFIQLSEETWTRNCREMEKVKRYGEESGDEGTAVTHQTLKFYVQWNRENVKRQLVHTAPFSRLQNS